MNIITHGIIFIIFFGLWFLLFSFHLFSPLLFPSPQGVIKAFAEVFGNGGVALDFWATIRRIFFGLAGGITFGPALGFTVALTRSFGRSLSSWIDFGRSIPAPALFPLFLLFFGIGEAPKIVLIIFVTTLIVTLATIYGVEHANSTRQLAGKSLGLSRCKRFIKIIFPETLPHISSGVRLALSFALVAVTVSEMLMSSGGGLGRKIVEYHLLYEIDKMYAVIIMVGFLGFAMNKFYVHIEKRFIHWSGK